MDTSRLPGLDFRPIHPDPVDNSKQRLRRPGVFRGGCVGVGPLPERRSTISAVSHPAATHLPHNTRVRNLSGGSAGSAASSASSVTSSSMGSVHAGDNHYCSHEHVTSHLGYDVTATQQHLGTNNSGAMSQQSKIGNGNSVSQHQQHRKLDRSLSDASSDSDRMSNGGLNGNNRAGNSSRYKTELCRPFEENGSCKYGDKCQFAHGYHELRNLSRHPKYKTELCRTFHTVGFCPYGPRCHFIHEDDGKSEPPPPKAGGARQPSRAASNYTPTSSSGSCSPSLSPAGSDTDYSAFTYHQEHNNDMLSLESSFSSLNFSNDQHQFGGSFTTSGSSNNNQQFDIFSQVTMFDSQEVEKVGISKQSYQVTQQKVDNFPFLNTSGLWKNDNGFQVCPPPQHHSPTGSTGSDGGVSDCSSSMESLASSGCRDHPTAGFTFPPFAAQHWIS